MTYRVVKFIKGRGYVYEQRTWREGKRVRTESRYIGPLDGVQRRRRGIIRKIADLIKENLTPPPPGSRIDEEQLWQEQRAREAREEQARQAKLAELHSKYGLRVAESKPLAVNTGGRSSKMTATVNNQTNPAGATTQDAAAGESSNVTGSPGVAAGERGPEGT